MQEDPAVGIALVPANSNQMGSHITFDCCVQRSRSAKLYALRTGRHGGQREQRPARHLADRDLTKTEMQLEKRSCSKAYCASAPHWGRYLSVAKDGRGFPEKHEDSCIAVLCEL